MTINDAKAKLASLANAQVGYREGENNWNKYAAELDPLGVTWGPKQNLPWCGEFVLWVFYKCFGMGKALELLCSPRLTGIPLCSMAAAYFKQAGRWYDTPEVGDVVFFIYDGGINHTGIVTAVNGGAITTVEGNSSDMVARRTYAINSTHIAGYGRPDWSVVISETEKTTLPETAAAETPTAKISGLPDLQRGDNGNTVKAAQILLNGRGCSVGIWGCDGDFGRGTEAAVLDYQRKSGLEADGIIGAQTWASLLGVR